MPDGRPPGEYLTDRLDRRGRQVHRGEQGRPFFLYLPHFAVHTPLRAKADLIAKYKGNAPAGRRRATRSTRRWSRAWTRASAGCMTKLDELKLADNTLVIFTSDNGGLGDVGGRSPDHVERPAARREGLALRGRHPRPVDRPVARRVQAGHRLPRAGDQHRLLPDAARDDGRERSARAAPRRRQPRARCSKGGTSPERPLFWHYPHYANQGGSPRRGGPRWATQADRVVRGRAGGAIQPPRRLRARRETSPRIGPRADRTPPEAPRLASLRERPDADTESGFPGGRHGSPGITDSRD